MINREYFKINKENMENQVRHLLAVNDMDLKVTKVLWDSENNIGLLRWNARTCKGLRLVFIEDNAVIVMNLSDYYRTTVEQVDILDDLYRAMRHRDKPDHIAEFRFR